MQNNNSQGDANLSLKGILLLAQPLLFSLLLLLLIIIVEAVKRGPKTTFRDRILQLVKQSFLGNASPILGYTKLGRFIQRKKYFFEYKHSTQFVREHTEDNLLPFLPGRDPSLKGRSPYLPTYLLGT